MKEFPTYLLARTRLANSHTLAVYRANGGYEALGDVLKKPWKPEEVTQVVKDSGLRGRGEGYFDTASCASARQLLLTGQRAQSGERVHTVAPRSIKACV